MADPPHHGPVAQTLGFRLALWYAAIFSASALLLCVIAYLLLARSLAARDHEIIRVKLADYAARYLTSGVGGLSQAVFAERAGGSPDRVFVRLVGPNAQVLLASMPAAWGAYELDRLDAGEGWRSVPARGAPVVLEVAARRLPDGTILQVGRTTLERERTLREVRELLGIVLACVLLLGLAGGGALTWSALRPIRDLRDTLTRITETGRLDARVPVPARNGDVLSELGAVSNAMLERIQTLVEGMHQALDTVAHDLRTPLARLRSRAEQLLVDGADSPARYREALADCVEEADRVSSLLTALMDISEAETGVMSLQREAVDVGAVLEETVDLYEDVAESCGISLRVSVPAEGVRCLADRPRLRQVLANLVDNAVKYTPTGGSIELAARDHGREVEISVRDTGVGIAADQLPRIWDRLYRGDAAAGGRGLGLGLSLVRAIVRAHGGRADVFSEPGHGSTFRVTLPAADTQPQRTGRGGPAGH